MAGFETKLFYGYSLFVDGSESVPSNGRYLEDIGVSKGPTCAESSEPLCSELTHHAPYTSLREFQIVNASYDTIVAKVPAHPDDYDSRGADRTSRLIVHVADNTAGTMYTQPDKFYVRTSSKDYAVDDDNDPITDPSLSRCFNNAANAPDMTLERWWETQVLNLGESCSISGGFSTNGVYSGDSWISYMELKPFVLREYTFTDFDRGCPKRWIVEAQYVTAPGATAAAATTTTTTTTTTTRPVLLLLPLPTNSLRLSQVRLVLRVGNAR